MVKELKNLPMEIFTLVVMSMGNPQVTENIIGLMEASSKGILKMG